MVDGDTKRAWFSGACLRSASTPRYLISYWKHLIRGRIQLCEVSAGHYSMLDAGHTQAMVDLLQPMLEGDADSNHPKAGPGNGIGEAMNSGVRGPAFFSPQTPTE